MTEEESAGYIGGAVTPEIEEAVGKAVGWVADTATDVVDWAAQEVRDVGETISDGVDTAEKWVEEHKDDLLM
jgi:hypothetical protein